MDRTPRLALVMDLGGIKDVPLREVPLRVARGALLVAREDEIFDERVPDMDMTLLSDPQRYRLDEGDD